jgi:F-box/WD-40 domain protein MET30
MTDPSVVNPFLAKYSPENRMNKYCYRHHPALACNRKTDTKLMHEIQQQLATLDPADQESISRVWAIFSAAPDDKRTLLLKGILAQCCFPQLSEVASLLDDLIRIDFVSVLPTEISYKILTYLDSSSLCKAAQVNKRWRQLADDDVVWHRLCEQHIDKKCTKCGWGLPLLEKKRLRESRRAIEARAKAASSAASSQPLTATNDNNKRPVEEAPEQVTKRRKTRPWKDVYAERYNIESNWRHGRFKTLEFKHSQPVLTLQFDEQHLITGTFNGTINVWDIETGELVRQMTEHLDAVSALKFDSTKIISGSYDKTLRVWSYRTGQCLSTFRGHEGKVLCLDFDGNIISSGSTDTHVRVWNFDAKTCFTLRGHKGAVNSVKIHSGSNKLYSCSDDATIRVWDLETKQCLQVLSQPGTSHAHVAQISSILPLFIDRLEEVPGDDATSKTDDIVVDDHAVVADEQAIESDDETQRERFNSTTARRSSSNSRDATGTALASALASTTPRPAAPSSASIYAEGSPTHILSASLDSTIKMWDVKTGRCVRTLFGHLEGVWTIAADNFRVVSGSLDKQVKVWDLQSGKTWHTFSRGAHKTPITCVGLSDTRMASAGDDGVVKMLCFDDGVNLR